MKSRLYGLINHLKDIEGFEEAAKAIQCGENVGITNLVDGNKAHMIHGLQYFSEKPAVVVTRDELSAKSLYEELQFLKGEGNVYLYPPRDILFYNADVHSMEITAERIRILEVLTHKEISKETVIIIPMEAMVNPLSKPDDWQKYCLSFKELDQIDMKALEKRLVEMGYERVGRVEGIGQFAIRGGIIDLYSPGSSDPYRIELWDEEIDSIRTFNINSQRSIEKVTTLKVLPNRELIVPIDALREAVPAIQKETKAVVQQLRKIGKREAAQNIEDITKETVEWINEGIIPVVAETYVKYTRIEAVTILEYLKAKEYVVYWDEPLKCKERCERILEEYEYSMQERLEHGHTLPKQIETIWTKDEVVHRMKAHTIVALSNFETQLEDITFKHTLSTRVYENNTFYNQLELFEKEIKEWKAKKYRVIVLAGIKSKAQRLQEELEARGVEASYSEELSEPVVEGQVVITKGSLNKGFIYEEIKLCIISDRDLFGKEKKKRNGKKYKGAKIESFLELSPGDYVVHEVHGIGVFKGVEQITIGGISKDSLKMEYANNTILYVNINQMDMVQKYIGAEGKVPKLSDLGSSDWKKAKSKAKKAVQDIAKDLIKLYSQRENTRGFVYDQDNIWQREFEDMFPYEETDDQLQAIEEVKRDMESAKIMDRLICGDVGYGKTEVAMRAAFKAIQSGKQVAYLVPTTILAKQHYERFEERMGQYPIKVELLCRFRTPKQIKQSLEGLQRGSVDIVIGTHRILSKDVKFKNLGLVIIDEEQRFGVTHKEKLKQMRTEVDVLTLTATPIPRTLHMGLVGVRDMSVLEDPPLERKPIQTYVIEYSNDFIKDAIKRELSRSGQVYFLHNQVRNIEEKALEIQNLVPQAHVGYAHGQMSERELEKIMLDFTDGLIDVLVCTTIIETGLDISNVNTIIINDADKMGLSQLYQLRGRVGRTNKVAYAYLMYKKDKALKEVAEKRLQAIKQFTQLGAGFKIAMRDLEIRGAGNLLGAQQHGHMEAIGYDLYCKMLKQAMEWDNTKPLEEVFETTIEIKVDAYIPAKYIPEEVEKLDIYKRIAMIQTEKDYMNLQEELEDRYGTMGQSVINLLDIALIKAMAHDLEILVVSQVEKYILFKFKSDAKLDMDKVNELVKAYPRKIKFTFNKEAVLQVLADDVLKKDYLSYIKSVLQDLKKLKKNEI